MASMTVRSGRIAIIRHFGVAAISPQRLAESVGWNEFGHQPTGDADASIMRMHASGIKSASDSTPN